MAVDWHSPRPRLGDLRPGPSRCVAEQTCMVPVWGHAEYSVPLIAHLAPVWFVYDMALEPNPPRPLPHAGCDFLMTGAAA